MSFATNSLNDFVDGFSGDSKLRSSLYGSGPITDRKVASPCLNYAQLAGFSSSPWMDPISYGVDETRL